MIDQLLGIWGSILGALAAVVLTVRASIPSVLGEANIEFKATYKEIKSKLASFAKGINRVWGSGDNQFDRKELPDPLQNIIGENKDNKQAGIYWKIEDHQEFWKNTRQAIAIAYYHVTGNKLTNHIEDFEYDDFVSINSKIFDDISQLPLSVPGERCRDFLDQFASLDFHRGLHQLCSERKKQKKRIKWLESTKKVTGFLSFSSLILIMICVFSSILLIHSKILWGYLFALTSIILFVFLVFCAFFMRERLNLKVLIGTSVCTVLLSFLSFFGLRSCYLEPYILPSISDKSLQAFQEDKSDRELFLKIFSPEWCIETFNQLFNDMSEGNGTIKVVGTQEMDIKSGEKSPSEKALLKIHKALDPDPLTKSKNKGKGLNHKNTPTNLGQQ